MNEELSKQVGKIIADGAAAEICWLRLSAMDIFLTKYPNNPEKAVDELMQLAYNRGVEQGHKEQKAAPIDLDFKVVQIEGSRYLLRKSNIW